MVLADPLVINMGNILDHADDQPLMLYLHCTTYKQIITAIIIMAQNEAALPVANRRQFFPAAIPNCWRIGRQ